MTNKKDITLEINGKSRTVSAAPNETLLDMLRREGNTDVKCGCEVGDCGACAVLVDGQAIDSCLTLAWSAEGRSIKTVAGLGTDADPHPLQEAFSERGAAQCGFCTPGMIIAAQSMLTNDSADPSLEEIQVGLSGNFCRCTGYTKIFDAVTEAAQVMRSEGAEQ